MAEFLGQVPYPKSNFGPASGFDAMGKPVPLHRRTAALHHMQSMGCTDTEQMFSCVQSMCQHIERDAIYEAMAAGMRLVDLIGTYRLLAVLLTAEPQEESNGHRRQERGERVRRKGRRSMDTRHRR